MSLSRVRLHSVLLSKGKVFESHWHDGLVFGMQAGFSASLRPEDASIWSHTSSALGSGCQRPGWLVPYIIGLRARGEQRCPIDVCLRTF